MDFVRQAGGKRRGGSAVSGRAGGKYWSAAVLRRRGWTNDMMKQLLPKPRFLASNGRSVRMWSQDDVRQAERDGAFFQGRKDPELRGAALRAASPGVKHAARLLVQAAGGTLSPGYFVPAAFDAQEPFL